MSPEYLYNNPEVKRRRQNLRNAAPTAEQLLWRHIKGKQLNGIKFRRQYGVGPFVIDFYCPELRLAIEVDGDSHLREGAKEYDERRQKYIENFNIQFLRFANIDVYKNIDDVLETICKAASGIKP
jgi:very-short-patch-repair endonuclease